MQLRQPSKCTPAAARHNHVVSSETTVLSSEIYRPLGGLLRRAVRARRHAAPGGAGADRRAASPRPGGAAGSRSPPRRGLRAAGHHVRDQRRGRPVPRTPLPARPDPARARRRGVARDQARAGAADPRAEPLRRRRLPRARDRARGDRPVAAGRRLPALRARGARHPAARRRLLPRRRLRSGAPQRRHAGR